MRPPKIPVRSTPVPGTSVSWNIRSASCELFDVTISASVALRCVRHEVDVRKCEHENISNVRNYYSASVLLAMQTAVIARAILSVRPSHSGVLSRWMNEDTIVWFFCNADAV